jgi:2'-5' RNA ligase
MAEPVQPSGDEATGYTADQVKALLDERIAEVQRNVEIAREAQPPHVTIQDYFERVEALRDRYEDKLAIEREKEIRLALNAANELEQERLGRNTDLIKCIHQISELRAELSQTAIDKAEESANKRFTEHSTSVKEQIDALTTAVQMLTQRLDKLV